MLKQMHPSFVIPVVSVGTNLRMLSKCISEWGTLVKVCLCTCAEMISLQIYLKWFCCDNSRSKQLRLMVFVAFCSQTSRLSSITISCFCIA